MMFLLIASGLWARLGSGLSLTRISTWRTHTDNYGGQIKINDRQHCTTIKSGSQLPDEKGAAEVLILTPVMSAAPELSLQAKPGKCVGLIS